MAMTTSDQTTGKEICDEPSYIEAIDRAVQGQPGTNYRSAGADARPGHGGFRGELLGVGPAEPARAVVQGRPGVERLPAGVAGRGPGGGRVGWADPGGGVDRPVRRAGDVPSRVGGDDRAGAVPGTGGARVACRAAGRRLLPGCGGHGVRGRGAVRQCLVLAGTAWSGDRDLRRR